VSKEESQYCSVKENINVVEGKAKGKRQKAKGKRQKGRITEKF